MRKLALVAIAILYGCASPAAYEPTDQQISELNDSALCSVSQTHSDPRLSAEIKTRNIDCEHASLVCGARGIKNGTNQFSSCKAGLKTEQTLQYKKKANPAYGYCIDSDFKVGTQAMATCMASYNQQMQNDANLARQQALMEQQMEQQRRAQTGMAMQALGAELLRGPPPSTVQHTSCTVGLGGNSMDCTTR